MRCLPLSASPVPARWRCCMVGQSCLMMKWDTPSTMTWCWPSSVGPASLCSSMSLPPFLVQYDLFVIPLFFIYLGVWTVFQFSEPSECLQVPFSCFLTVFLTFFGLTSIGLSCLMALFLYHVVFGVRYLGILNGVAAFVIIGIGKGKLYNMGNSPSPLFVRWKDW